MRLSDLLSAKGDHVESIAPGQTLGDAASILAQRRIGALVVSEPSRRIAGIISERDIVRAVAEGGASALDRSVSEVMTTPVTTCDPDDDVTDLMALMTTSRFRHVPVVRDGELLGILSIGDVVKSRVDQLERDRKELLEYVAGR